MNGIILTILAILIAQSAADVDDYTYAFYKNEYKFFGSKTPYEYVRATEKTPSIPNCETVQLWMLARHGVQYPDREYLNQRPTLINLHKQIKRKSKRFGTLSNAVVNELNHVLQNLNESEAEANHLTITGISEMILLSQHIREWLNSSQNYENYKFRSTNSQATRTSLQIFIESLLNNQSAVPVEQPPAKDILLSAHTNCPAWKSGFKNDRVDAEAEKFFDSSEYKSVIANVSQRLGFNDTINKHTIQLLYDTCRHDTAAFLFTVSPWCSVFSTEDLKVLEYADDLFYYYYSGPGRDINAKLGCELLKDLFHHFKNLELGDFNNEPKGVFYFTDTITVQTFLAALGIRIDSTPLRADNFQSMHNRDFRTSILGAFASNVIAAFYRCNDTHSQYKVAFYLNQWPVKMNGCEDGICDWNYLKKRFGKTAEECSLDFCNDVTTTSGDKNGTKTAGDGKSDITTAGDGTGAKTVGDEKDATTISDDEYCSY